jgi:hypothetical protein
MATPIDSIAKTVLAPKIATLARTAGNDAERSKAVLGHYLTQVIKPLCADPSNFQSDVTDGPNDGGLDGWGTDPHDPDFPLVLVQCKWSLTGGRNLSFAESTELSDFVSKRLSPNLRAGLNPSVQQFLGRYQASYANKAKILLVYLTPGVLNPAAQPSYDALKPRCEFKVLDGDQLAKEWYESLSREEPIASHTVVGLDDGAYFESRLTVPSTIGGPSTTIRVLECKLAATDLRWAYDNWLRKLLIRNLRYGLGVKGINKAMKETAESDRRYYFFAFHNGISIVCDHYDVLEFTPLTDKSKTGVGKAFPQLTEAEAEYSASLAGKGTAKGLFLRGLQIVNGGQSTLTLSQVDSKYLGDIAVPCKITETDARDLAAYIAIYNNSQNKIVPEDLVANSQEQSFLQNYAALEVSPPIFYQRKRKESWTDIFRVASPRPPTERCITYRQTYQAFAAFTGDPIGAYSSPGTYTDPAKPPYAQITDYPNKDTLLLSGLLSAFEDKLSSGRDPAFAAYWKQWAIALFGHFFRTLPLADQEKLTGKLMGTKGLNKWKQVRATLLSIFEQVLKSSFSKVRGADYQALFKGNASVFDLSTITGVKPGSVAALIHPKAAAADFRSMEKLQRDQDVLIGVYELHFAIIVRMAEAKVQASASLQAAISGWPK